MLTIDDANTIIKKYGEWGYWREFDLADIPLDEGGIYSLEEIIIILSSSSPYFRVGTPFLTCIYFTNHDGDILNVDGIMSKYSDGYMGVYNLRDIDNDMIVNIFTVIQDIDSSLYDIILCPFTPISPLKIPVVNGEFDEKFYIANPHRRLTDYTINDVSVSLETDEHGTYLTLPSSEDCYVGGTWSGRRYMPFKITFFKSKELPIPYIPTLYKGTPQNVQVLNTEDDEPISDYKTYYQGRLLKDNIIHLPYDSDDYVDIMVDLKDYRYPFCTVKLKAPTTIYTANSQSDVETAIENGIQTLQVGDTETEVTLNSITLSNVTLINSNIQVSESILNDCQIIDTTYTDNGGNNITNTIFNSVDYTNTAQSNYNEITFNECDIHDSEINLTGTISKSTITDTLILSDGVINIRDNTFTGVGLKEYFPSHLYLTGDYTVTGNTFNLTGEWEELQYNMCLIKATTNFNPSEFIKQNNLQLNITYDDEPTNTFYYNIVDDDKIRAVRL